MSSNENAPLLLKEPNTKQVQFWLNRMRCGPLRSEEEKRLCAIRKFHNKCGEEMVETMQDTLLNMTTSLKFKKKIAKPDIDEVTHLTERLLSASQLFASPNCLADNANGESLHVEIEEEFEGFFEEISTKYELGRYERDLLAKHQACIENYFYHFHRIRRPIQLGVMKKYWEEYSFTKDTANHDNWKAGEPKFLQAFEDGFLHSDEIEPVEDCTVARMPQIKSRKSNEVKLNKEPTYEGDRKRMSTDLGTDEESVDDAGEAKKRKSKKNAP